MRKLAYIAIAAILFGVTALSPSLAPASECQSAYGNYSRCKFGSGWATTHKMNTRHRVLMQRARGQIQLFDNGQNVKVLIGTFVDQMSGEVIHDVNPARKLQVDHIVPLHWAWEHGADGWNYEMRRAFANDTDFLLVTRAHNNMSKGDLALDRYLPINHVLACEYARKFNAALARYPFEVTLAEQSRFHEVERRACSGQVDSLS